MSVAESIKGDNNSQRGRMEAHGDLRKFGLPILVGRRLLHAKPAYVPKEKLDRGVSPSCPGRKAVTSPELSSSTPAAREGNENLVGGQPSSGSEPCHI